MNRNRLLRRMERHLQ